MEQVYCEIHTRIKLEDGKCFACGEVPYQTEEQKQMSDKTRVKWLLFVYSVFFTFFAGLMWLTTR